MKIIRYSDSHGEIHWATLHSDRPATKIYGDIFGAYEKTEEPAQITRLLSPIEPRAIWCIGLNYRQHAIETGAKIPEFPVLFMKGVNSLQHPDQPILLPTQLASHEVDYEVELAVVIGRSGKNIAREHALDHVLGYTVANDVSARDWQKKWGGTQWCRAKTFDTFCPLGPCLVTKDEIPNPQALAMRTRVNGETLQSNSTADMIFDVARLIEFLSGSTTLLAGTIILTGTPEGVGMARTPPRWLQPGDQVEVEIDGIGTLRNPIESEGKVTPSPN